MTPSLVVPPPGSEGFIHLSRPDQLALPANRLFAGRDDMLLLVIDPGRLTAEVRWEPGVARDPSSMRFPHLYGPLPTAAVTSVVPYRPAGDGRFAEPIGLPEPSDALARARTFERSLAERRAAAVIPVAGGVAAVDPRVAASHEHNSLWVDGDLAADVLGAEADRVLAGAGHRRIVLDRAPPPDLGWAVDEERIMVLDTRVTVAAPPDITVIPVGGEVTAGLWGPAWRRDVPGISDTAVDDLLGREALADAHLLVVHLAVLDDAGRARAGTQLRLDGATAAVEAVLTDPGHRGQGLASALVADAVARARGAGCDVVWLTARANDWPRRWYERLGFTDVGAHWVATTTRRPPPG